MKKIKVIFFGTPDYSIPTFKALIEDLNIEVLGLVTQSKKSNRDFAIRKVAHEFNIPIYDPSNLKKDKETLSKLKEMKVDFFIVVAYGQILSQEVLDIPKKGCINGHGSLLPKYRGASPIQNALLNAEKVTGVTTILMDKGVDTGKKLLKQQCNIDPENDNLISLSRKLANITSSLILESIKRFDNITPSPQINEINNPTTLLTVDNSNSSPIVNEINNDTFLCKVNTLDNHNHNPSPSKVNTLDNHNPSTSSLKINEIATYTTLIPKSSYLINWDLTCYEIHNIIKAFYPEAYFNFLDGEQNYQLKVLQSKVVDINFIPLYSYVDEINNYRVLGRIKKQGILIQPINNKLKENIEVEVEVEGIKQINGNISENVNVEKQIKAENILEDNIKSIENKTALLIQRVKPFNSKEMSAIDFSNRLKNRMTNLSTNIIKV
jgi:methionyl-tRNA formyltransferase